MNLKYFHSRRNPTSIHLQRCSSLSKQIPSLLSSPRLPLRFHDPIFHYSVASLAITLRFTFLVGRYIYIYIYIHTIRIWNSRIGRHSTAATVARPWEQCRLLRASKISAVGSVWNTLWKSIGEIELWSVDIRLLSSLLVIVVLNSFRMIKNSSGYSKITKSESLGLQVNVTNLKFVFKRVFFDMCGLLLSWLLSSLLVIIVGC